VNEYTLWHNANRSDIINTTRVSSLAESKKEGGDAYEELTLRKDWVAIRED